MLRQQFRRALEQPDIVPLDPAHVAYQRRGKVIAILEAEKPGKDFEGLGLGRQRVGLLIGHHLQPVLDAAQKIISRSQFVARLPADPIFPGQRVESAQWCRYRAIAHGGRRR